MRRRWLALILAALTAATPAAAQHWRTGWYASPQPVWRSDFVLPSNLPATLEGRTVEQRVRVNLGGSAARLVLSNRYGREPVRIAAVTLGASGLPVRFDGHTAVTLPAGGEVTSDPVRVSLHRGEDVGITMRFDDEPVVTSFHWDGRSTARIRGRAPTTTTTTVRLFLSKVLVERPQACAAIVALGDSITDGAGIPLNSDVRWTDLLARRAGEVAVINAGISGARLLTDGMGDKALDRFNHDVTAQPGARAVVLLLGTNDIAWPGSPFAPEASPMTLARLTAGYRSFAATARARGLVVIGATIPPFEGALPGTPLAGTYYTPAKERLRRQVNAWMRREHPFDRLVDLDMVLRDPRRPSRLLPRYDSGDHLHPGPAGNAAIAQAIDLASILPQPCKGNSE